LIVQPTLNTKFWIDPVTQKVTGIGATGETDQQQITQYQWDINYRGRRVYPEFRV